MFDNTRYPLRRIVAIAMLAWLATTPSMSVAAAPPDGEDPPITVAATRHIRLGCAAALTGLVSDTFQTLERFPGHVATDFLPPATADSDVYVIIVKFDRTSHDLQWLKSPERARWLEHVARVTEGDPQYQVQSGLQAWVTLPGEPGEQLPEKYKTVTVTWLSVLPLALTLSSAIGPLMVGWDMVSRTALMTGVLVSTLNYGVLPVTTWLFHDWLHPTPRECQADQPA